MNYKRSRRLFLKTSMESSLALGAFSISMMASAAPVSIGAAQGSASSGIDPRLKDLLRVAMDTIIPATDGMPSANAAGGVRYLERLAQSEPVIKRKLEGSLNALNQVSLKFFNSEFSALPPEKRVESLKQLESQAAPELFADLRDSVYESYYTQPLVWKLIGYEFYPTNHHGPHMNPFDETVLSQVKKMGQLYREVS
jgi:hypothetical protein